MGEVPRGVHEPCDADEAVGAETGVREDRACHRVGELPEAETAAQVDPARAGHDHGVEVPSSGLFHERHEDDEDDRRNGRADVVGDMKRWGVLHACNPREPGRG